MTEDMAGMETNDLQMLTSGVVNILSDKLDAVILYGSYTSYAQNAESDMTLPWFCADRFVRLQNVMPFYRNIQTVGNVLWKAA